jgi:hypothetical protein
MDELFTTADGLYMFRRESLDWAEYDRCVLYKSVGAGYFLFVDSIDCATGRFIPVNEESARVVRENLQLLLDKGLIDAIKE